MERTAPRPLDPQRAATACLECGALVTDRYCGRCGQEHLDPEPPAGKLLRASLTDAFGADATLWRTLRTLLASPGLLTLEYLAGRRRRYLPPLRLYLLASLPFATLAVTTPAGQSMIKITPSGELAARTLEVRETFFDVWPLLLVAAVPAFAAVYALLLRGMRASYTRHLVFTLHFHAFGFVALSVAQVVWYVPPPWLGRLLSALCLLAPIPYVAIALRRAYALSWWRAGTTVSVLLVLNLLLLAATAWLAFVMVGRLLA